MGYLDKLWRDLSDSVWTILETHLLVKVSNGAASPKTTGSSSMQYLDFAYGGTLARFTRE